MGAERKALPVVSTACRWPLSAFESLDKTQDWVERLGRGGLVGVEVIPSWGLLASIRREESRAVLDATDLVHETYWEDRRREGWSGWRLKVQNGLLTLPSLPPGLARKATFALAAETVPVVTHWPGGERGLPPRQIAEIHPQILLTPKDLQNWVEQDLDHRGVALPLISDVRYLESGHLAGAIASEKEAWEKYAQLLPRTQVLYWKLPKDEGEREEVILAVRDRDLDSPVANQMKATIKRVGLAREGLDDPLRIVLNFKLPDVKAAGGDEFLKQAITFIRLL